MTVRTIEFDQQVADLERDWAENPRWQGIKRVYSAADVVRLRGTLHVENTLAQAGAERLWELLQGPGYTSTFGALNGSQAVQMVKAGLQAIYLSGWQVAADANTAGQVYPDQSLYPVNSGPELVKRLNNALMRADQIQVIEGKSNIYWYAPIVADAEAGFGGPIHAYELMRNMIEAGASGVHYEDQLAAEKKCGHMGGKVLVPTSQFIRTLNAARLAADVAGVPTILVARTDALDATLLTSDIDPEDRDFITGDRTAEGYFRVSNGMDAIVARGLAYAPYSDLLWFECSHPDLEEAQVFADAIHRHFPGKALAYNCSPSFNWRHKMDDAEIARFQSELGRMNYKFQFITLAGWHMVNVNTFELAKTYQEEGMPAYVRLQDREFALEDEGYTATRHQRQVGAEFFDRVMMTVSGGEAATTALAGSTESAQFHR